ncbi:hypothetical protein KAX17_14010 [Candidatus Bipolaricaulota bacterium]|nr:hypothetical protein [Candidatus Bipolaricaulota bacterium]
MSDRREETDQNTGISKLEQRDWLKSADQLKIKVCEGLISMQPDYGTVQVNLGIMTAHSEIDSLRGRSAAFQGPGDGLVQHQALTHGAERILAGERKGKFLSADLGIMQSDVGGVTCEVREAAFNFKTPPALSPASGSVLQLSTVESALRIEEGALITQPTPDMFSIDANAPISALGIEQGAFTISPAVDQLSLDGVSPNMQIAKNTLVIEKGMLVANPTERLLAGENSFLGVDPSRGTLFVREEPLSLSTGYLSNSQLALDTQGALASIEWTHIAEGLGADILDRTRIQNNLLDLSDSYSRLLIGDESRQAGLAALPSSVAMYPPAEYYNNLDVIGQITSPWEFRVREGVVAGPEILEREELVSSEEELLAQLESMGGDLPPMLRGAVRSLSSQNPERVRHFSTSMRELFTQVIHRLAPNKEIEKWSTNESDYNNGRPTRSARIRYICREIDQPPFDDFVKFDVKSTLELANLFQKGTHAPKSTYTEGQLQAMRVLMENSIRSLIVISRA